jgi:diguanylate cyclase (GGDEF)-like protein/PAS domain S-box-containing protein
MSYDYTPYILPFIGAAAVFAALLRVAWNNRRDPIARWFAATLLFMLSWAVGYVFELMSVSREQMIFWANLQFVGAGTAWICWWETARRYLGVRPPSRPITVLIWAIPAVTLVLAFWNPGEVFRGDAEVLAGAAPFAVLDPKYGAWYRYVFMPEVALLNAATLFILIRAALRAPSFLRRQYMLLLIALTLPLASTLQYVFGLGLWPHYNLTVAVSGVSGILLAVGLFRWRLFNLVPLARSLVVENLADGVIVADNAGLVADVNGAAESIFGVKRRDAVGQPVGELLYHHDDLCDLLLKGSCGDASVEGGNSRSEMALAGNSEIRHYGLTGSPVLWHDGQVLGRAVVIHDVTERVRLAERTRVLANTDDLTGLVNRRRFLEVAAKELERNIRYGYKTSVALFDIDRFKEVNDTYGHRAGDVVLAQIAKTCLKAFRRVDLVGRFGGEEFAVLMPETDLQEALLACERLRETIEQLEMSVDGSTCPVNVTVSAGVVEFDECLDECRGGLDSVIARADGALYEAKAQGRNTVVTTSSTVSAPRCT